MYNKLRKFKNEKKDKYVVFWLNRIIIFKFTDIVKLQTTYPIYCLFLYFSYITNV